MRHFCSNQHGSVTSTSLPILCVCSHVFMRIRIRPHCIICILRLTTNLLAKCYRRTYYPLNGLAQYEGIHMAQSQNVTPTKSQSQVTKQQTATTLAQSAKTFTPGWLRPAQAAAYIGISKPTLYRKLKDDPTFPRPHRLGDACTVLNREALDQWVMSHVTE